MNKQNGEGILYYEEDTVAEETLAETLGSTSLPTEPEGASLIRFSKQFQDGDTEYDYAGLKASDGLWYLTGRRAPQGMEWEQLMVWLFLTGPMPKIYYATELRELQ